MNRIKNSKILSVGLVLLGFSVANQAFAIRALQDKFVKHYESKNPQIKVDASLKSCGTCHQPVIEDALNYYGLAIKKLSVAAGTQVDLNKIFNDLDDVDSDGDGVTNKDEVQSKDDPSTEKIEDPATNPGSHARTEGLFVFTPCAPLDKNPNRRCDSNIEIGNVKFPHDRHVLKRDEGGLSENGINCVACHNDQGSRFKDKNFNDLNNSYEKRNIGHDFKSKDHTHTCVGCHEGYPNAPQADNSIANGCNGCHASPDTSRWPERD